MYPFHILYQRRNVARTVWPCSFGERGASLRHRPIIMGDRLFKCSCGKMVEFDLCAEDERWPCLDVACYRCRKVTAVIIVDYDPCPTCDYRIDCLTDVVVRSCVN